MFFWLPSMALVCVAHLPYTWPCIAFPLLQIKHLCVFCDILSPRALYGFVVLLFQTQDVEDQFCEWLLPILEKTLGNDPVPLQSPPPLETATWRPFPPPPPPPQRLSRANGGECKGGGGY